MKPLKPWTPSEPEGRWATLGPYYAMFPIAFVRDAVRAYSKPGEGILDPFCGRGTVPFVAAASGRYAVGVDINPVAWVFAAAKSNPEPDVARMLSRVEEISSEIRAADREPENEFQRWCWTPEVLGFLRAARRALAWRSDRTDWTLTAIILVHLHGKIGGAVSNQMRQSKAMSPDYSIKWWRAKESHPPEIDPVAYFKERVQWRYAKGIPSLRSWAEIELGDARTRLQSWKRSDMKLMLTSPPYCDVTNYRADNWIRLWILGEGALPSWEASQRYADKVGYRRLLAETFSAAKDVLAEDATILVRTDTREFTRDVTAATLRHLWPEHRMLARATIPNRSQTSLFGDRSQKPGETDFLLLAPGDRRRPLGMRRVRPDEMSSVEVWTDQEGISPLGMEAVG